MGETKTFGVKVPEELHQEATDLQRKLGLSGEGFLNELLNAYKLEKAKEELPQSIEDLKELQSLTQRINNIYINLGYRVDSITKEKDIETQTQLAKKDTIIYDLQGKNEDTKEENMRLTEAYNNSVNQKNESIQRVNELTESNNNIKALIEEYKAKNDTLTGILEEYKQYKEQIETVKGLLADSQARNIDLNSTIKDKEHDAFSLNEQIKSLKEKHLEEMKSAEEKANLKLDKEVLKLRTDHQVVLQQIQNKHNIDITEYQAKYKALLEELEQTKKVKPQQTAKSKVTKKDE